MKRCKRVGINVTKRCNWRCKTCFYRWAEDFNADYHKPLAEALKEAHDARAIGCDHVVLIGWGEPGLWPHLLDFVKEVTSWGLTSSIITNGSLRLDLYENLRKVGLDHLHISVHGLGSTLDEISGMKDSGLKQSILMTWLQSEAWPWRMNMTLQKSNFESLEAIADTCLEHGCEHVVALGFLPHYEWNDPAKLKEVAVHPELLRFKLERIIDRVISAGKMMTVRYHPMCHIGERYRKYIVNARYVPYDPWEWLYSNPNAPEAEYWEAACKLGNSVAVQEAPCVSCGLRIHCGGWNKIYAAGFDGAGLKAIDMPEATRIPGWLHNQNPTNQGKGFFGKMTKRTGEV